MFKNPFKKSPPAEPKQPVTLLGALGVTPYRTNEVKALPLKNKIRRPYKLPAIGYAVIAFVSCIMAGLASDVVFRLMPWTHAAQASTCLAFMCLAFFCGTQATQKWKH